MAYKARTKIQLENAIAVADIVHRESGNKDGNVPIEFVGLFQPFWNEPLMVNAVMDHGIYFQKAYCALLTGLGFTHKQVRHFQMYSSLLSDKWLVYVAGGSCFW